MIGFQEVGKTYPDGTTAVENFSYEVREGRIVALVGASGSGKTTLLRMVNRMVEPTSGSVWVDGRNVSDVDRVQLRRSIGYVLQAGGLLPHRTIIDNVATVPLLNGEPKKKARRAAEELLERVGLEVGMGKRILPAQLSGGQQQRVGVARALAADPKVLLMDEPFGAVDPIVRKELQVELRRLQTELGKTVILVTHDVDEAFNVGHDVCSSGQGRGDRPVRDARRDPVIAEGSVCSPIHWRSRAERQFTIEEINGQRLIFDGDGRPAGILQTVTWLSHSWRNVLELLLVHLSIAVPAIIIATLIAIPIGRFAYRFPRVGGPVLSASTLLYAIPALPMLIIIPVIFSTSLRSATTIIIALIAYGVALLVRSAADGFAAVDRSVR